MISQTSKISFRSLRMLLILPILALLVAFSSFDTASPVVVKAKHTIVLVLDAGHGGEDAGARSRDGLEEKALTLSVADKIAHLAPEYNVEVVRTRKEDKTLSLQERVSGAAAISEGVFVSIHINKSVDHATGNPYEVIISGGNKEMASSKALATAVIGQLEAMKLKVPLADRALKVLRDNKLPAIAIECGDIDNPEQMALLTSDPQLSEFCRKILSGIVLHDNYLHKHR